MYLKPKLEILPEAQQQVFPQLQDIPKHFVLYGGTAIALRFGHRQSVDFDFFTSKQHIDLAEIGRNLPFVQRLGEQNINCKKHNDNHVDFRLNTEHGVVKLSLINNKDLMPGVVGCPDKIEGNGIKIASPLDLMAAKILALHNRTEAKDYFDMHELVKQGIPLQKGYEAAFAIAKISRLRSSQLMLDRLNAEFQSKTVERVVAESELPEIRSKAKECSEVLKEAAQSVRLERVPHTKLRAGQHLEKGVSLGRGL